MLGHRESDDHLYSGWYEVQEGKIIIVLKKSGDLFARRYEVDNTLVAQQYIDTYVQSGTRPNLKRLS